MPLRFERSHQFQRIELIITASVGPVWSGQHLEHNAQRQKAPTHSTRYSAITIEENNFSGDDKFYPLILVTALETQRHSGV